MNFRRYLWRYDSKNSQQEYLKVIPEKFPKGFFEKSAKPQEVFFEEFSNFEEPKEEFLEES